MRPASKAMCASDRDFIDLSQIPILTINLLQALPRTPLWDRLQRDGRLIADEAGLESNVRFRSELYRSVADSDPHHQSAAGAAADALVGSPATRRPIDRR